MKGKIALLAALALLLGGFPVTRAEKPDADIPAPAAAQGTSVEPADEWRRVCANDRFELRMNSYNGGFSLTDRRGGAVWSSTPEGAADDTIASGVYKMELLSNLIVYGQDIEQDKEFKRNSETASVRKGGVSVTLAENGFTAVYRFPAEGWTIPVQVALEKERLSVTVDTAGIIEEQPEKYRIASLCLLPYLGAGGLQEDGYMLLPDGSGSLMQFNNGKYLGGEYAVPLYGRDISTSLQVKYTEEQSAALPVFGFSKAQGGLLAIVSEGAEVGTVHAQPNRRTSEWASAYCEFRLRPSDIFVLDADSGLPQSVSMYYREEIQTPICQLLLYPLEPDEGDYSGMARTMRRYLSDTFGLTAGSSQPGLYVDLYGAVKKRESFLGIPVERTKLLTGADSAAELLDELNEAGLDGIRMRYLSWSKDGLSRKVEKTLSPAGGLGSQKELLALQERLDRQGGRLYLDAELQSFYKGGNGVSDFFDVSRSLSNAPAYQYEFPLSTGLRKNNGERGLLLSPSKLSDITGRLFGRAKKIGYTSLSLGSLAGTLYADYSSSVMATRSKSLAYVRQAMENKPAEVSLLADAPHMYALAWTDEAVNLPSVSSRYDAADRSVPFLQMVYSGLMPYALMPVNLSADPQDSFLKALETGAGLHYALLTGDNRVVMDTRLNYLTSAQADTWMTTIKEQGTRAVAVWAETGGSPIHSHTVVADGVTRTLYENGAAVYVNRGTADWQEDGIRVPAGGYAVKQEG